MTEVKVEHEDGLVRDPRTKAILNKDALALQKYKAQREKMSEVQRAVEEIPQLKRDIGEIKEMLAKLLSKV
jgi:hypothetical protein